MSPQQLPRANVTVRWSGLSKRVILPARRRAADRRSKVTRSAPRRAQRTVEVREQSKPFLEQEGWRAIENSRVASNGDPRVVVSVRVESNRIRSEWSWRLMVYGTGVYRGIFPPCRRSAIESDWNAVTVTQKVRAIIVSRNGFD